MTHTELNQVIREYMRELYEMEFVGDIKIESLDPIGYKVSIYTTRGSEHPVVLIADLQEEQFLQYIKEELRSKKLHKTKYFSAVKIPNEGSNMTPYSVKNNQYVTEVTAPFQTFIKLKNENITISYHDSIIRIPVLSNGYWHVTSDNTENYDVSYEGIGSGQLVLYPKTNYGKDKIYTITLASNNNNITTSINVYQIGMRESFESQDGEFILLNGQEFLSLKDGILE